MTDRRHPAQLALAALVLALLAWSGAFPFDRATWALETFPVMLGLVVLPATYRRFPLTTLLYVGLAFHAVVLMLGGAYSYARVPLGFEIAELLHLSRNPYDKIGHFFQGFVPALLAREILIRGAYVKGRKMLAFLVASIVLAFSALYELFEWGIAEWLGQGADEFLGTQGYAWDTQSDMAMALLGAIVALATLSRWHDRQIKRLERDKSPLTLLESPLPGPGETTQSE